jgi:ferredoxin-fold anticodon binding domain-containing protein
MNCGHYQQWKIYTGQEVEPNRLKVWFFTLISRLLGITFGVKLMELGEEQAQVNYAEIAAVYSRIQCRFRLTSMRTKKNCWLCWMKSTCAMLDLSFWV